MLSDEEENTVKNLFDSSLEKTPVHWLSGKLLEVNTKLKILMAEKCDGDERHRHYSIDKRAYVYHTHPHSQRITVDFNSLHHHPPQEHRLDERGRKEDSTNSGQEAAND